MNHFLWWSPKAPTVCAALWNPVTFLPPMALKQLYVLMLEVQVSVPFLTYQFCCKLRMSHMLLGLDLYIDNISKCHLLVYQASPIPLPISLLFLVSTFHLKHLHVYHYTLYLLVQHFYNNFHLWSQLFWLSIINTHQTCFSHSFQSSPSNEVKQV